tara:strand:- start:8893 stop:10113 length:1221 start_codon:yes stop_codon:yes gene_type:complete
MRKNGFQLKNYINTKTTDTNLIKKYSKKFNIVFKELIKNEINGKRKTLNILNNNFNFNLNFRELKKFNNFKTIAIIGMGGSILGAEALNNFLNGKIKRKIYFFNNIDITNIKNFKKKNNLTKVLFLVISKSGNTIETLSNLFFLKIIKKKAKNIIIISEKKNNPLYLISKKYDLLYIEHKNYIGGRYSVLSEVGMVPAYLMGLNTVKLRTNLKRFFYANDKIILKDSSIKLASLIQKSKFTTSVFLNYVPELEKFLYWCQQLLAESLGKKGKGFMPIISNVPKDHHSLLQLYLDGPKDKIFNIFSYNNRHKNNLNTKKVNKDLKYLHNKSLDEIKLSQKEALLSVLKKNRIPFREFKLNKIDESEIGQLFSYFILETVIIGKLININPFDQPAVEQVKIQTKRILS